jgi:GxxExxY protein
VCLGVRIVLADDLEALKERVIACGIEVHRTLGPGLLESIYRDCMAIELRAAGLSVEREHRVAIRYRDQTVGASLKVDLVVDNRLIMEIKAVERPHPVFMAQVITYLKLTGLPVGLLMNFNTPVLRTGLKVLVHPDLYKQPSASPMPREQ